MRFKYTLTLRGGEDSQNINIYTSRRQALKAFWALAYAVAPCGYSEMLLNVSGSDSLAQRTTFKGGLDG